MQPELTGNITKGTYTHVVNYADKIIDSKNPCWINTSDKADRATSVTRVILGEHTVYIPGEDKKFTDLICNKIANAQEMIVLSSYLLQSGAVTDALLKQTKQGVPVIILSARAEDFDKTNDDEQLTENFAKIIEEHKQLLDSFAGKILVRTAPHFHTKFILCDPKSETASGIMMTCNATVDAMNGKNIELGIVLNHDEIKSFFAFFLQGFWNEAKHELFVPGHLSAIRIDPDVLKSIDFGQVTNPATFIAHSSLKDTILQTINSATESLDIGAWTLNHPDLLNLIQTKAKLGVKVNIYAHISVLNSEKLANLIATGVTIYGHKRLHAKFVFADKTHGLVMTSNISNRGLDDGFDSGVLFTETEADTISKIIEAIASSCTYRYITSPKVEDCIPGTEGYMFNKTALNKLIPIHCTETHESKRSISSPIDMVNPFYIDNAIEKSATEIRICQRENITIAFTPDVLPAEDQLEKEATELPSIPRYVRKDNKNKKYVCVRNWEDISSIIDLTKKGYTPVISEKSDSWGALPASAKGLVESILMRRK